MRRLAVGIGLGLLALVGGAPAADAAVLDEVVCMEDLDGRKVFPEACALYERLIGPVGSRGEWCLRTGMDQPPAFCWSQAERTLQMVCRPLTDLCPV